MERGEDARSQAEDAPRLAAGLDGIRRDLESDADLFNDPGSYALGVRDALGRVRLLLVEDGQEGTDREPGPAVTAGGSTEAAGRAPWNSSS